METLYASDFTEIHTVLAQNTDLRNEILNLIDTQPIAGKVTEGGDRLPRFRVVLKDLVQGNITLAQAYRATETAIPRQGSEYASNNRVFPHDWAERHVRTQLSRFYNQAVMDRLLAQGQTQCFVPHSSAEDGSSSCTKFLAGQIQDLKTLHTRLVESYGHGEWSKELKVPNHPHCTHVVRPLGV